MNDSVIILYKKMLSEMTFPIPDVNGGLLTDADKKTYVDNVHHFDFTKTNSMNDLGHFLDGNKHIYVTFSNGTPIHTAHIYNHPKHAHGVPFSHDTQSMVSQDIGTRSVAREAMMHHIEHSSVPLISDWGQSGSGHSMWRKFAKESIDRGHHVYMWDGNQLHKSTRDNVESHLDDYYGIDKKLHRMVVSQKDLTNA